MTLRFRCAPRRSPARRRRPRVRFGKLSRAVGFPLTRSCVAPFERRPYPPGVHGRRRVNASDYKVRLLEKQRLRLQYDLRETQPRRAFGEADRKQGKTGEILVALLERRLDAVVLRSGLARTIYQARQFVTHRHITVNGRRVDRPSYRTRPGDVVSVVDRSRALDPFVVAAARGNAPDGEPVPYLATDLGTLTVRVERLPERPEIPVRCEEQLVVEYYSR
ncbi:MAG TPA: 30S ribosomal protein S4 [Actinocatenispora sp.]